MFLEDGAGYRETAKSTGIPRQTLAYNLPGMGMSVEDTNLYRMAVMKYEIRKA